MEQARAPHQRLDSHREQEEEADHVALHESSRTSVDETVNNEREVTIGTNIVVENLKILKTPWVRHM